MKLGEVTDTLDPGWRASGCDQATVVHKPCMLSDNGPNYKSGELIEWLEHQKWIMFEAHSTNRRYKARLSGGIRLSKTTSYWKITICPVTGRPTQ